MISFLMGCVSIRMSKGVMCQRLRRAPNAFHLYIPRTTEAFRHDCLFLEPLQNPQFHCSCVLKIQLIQCHFHYHTKVKCEFSVCYCLSRPAPSLRPQAITANEKKYAFRNENKRVLEDFAYHTHQTRSGKRDSRMESGYAKQTWSKSNDIPPAWPHG